MNAIIRASRRQLAGTCGLAVCCAALLFLGGCHKSTSGADAPSTANEKNKADESKDKAADGKDKTADAKTADAKGTAADAEGGEGVSLKPEEVEKLGVVTTEVQTIMHTPESTGFGTVVPHETIATAVAELTTATAIERQSRSAFLRGQKLAGTPGAMPADVQEAAQRQSIVDQAALELAKRKLSSTFGQNPPWKNQGNNPELSALAGGDIKLVRVTFPLGSVSDTLPMTLRLAHINAAPGSKSWESRSVWNAPADANVPGKSFFALLKGSDAGEGERLLAWVPVGDAESGVLIPAAAAVISGGKYWCYVEEKPGTFVRTEIDTSMPTADGYFVKAGVSAGDKVVTTAAGQLLARETNPSKEAE